MPAKSDETTSSASLYRTFLDEREEVLKLKWILSEEAGLDVGLETTLVDWALNFRASWKAEPASGSRS